MCGEKRWLLQSKQDLAAHRQCYGVTSLHMENGWVTLQHLYPCLCAAKKRLLQWCVDSKSFARSSFCGVKKSSGRVSNQCEPGIASFASNHGYSRDPKRFLPSTQKWKMLAENEFWHVFFHFYDCWKKSELLGCPRMLGSKVRISGLQSQYTPFISRWNNPLILTIDPNKSNGTS